MDIRQARRNLRAMTLPRPQEFPLLLVACAVAAGARDVSVECDRSRLRLCHDGEGHLEDWHELFQLPKTQVRRWPTLLALGLNSALKVASRITVQGQGPEGPVQVTLTPRTLDVTSDQGSPNGLEVLCEFSASWLPWIRPSQGAARSISARCQRCPSSLSLDGASLGKPVSFPDCLAMLHLAGTDRSLQMDPGDLRIHDQRYWERPYSAVMGLLKTPTQGGLEVVVDGVSYFKLPPRWPKGVVAVVSAPGQLWRRDSQDDVAEDAAYHRLLEDLSLAVDELEQELLNRFESLRPDPAEVLTMCNRFEHQFKQLHPRRQTAVLRARLAALESRLPETHPLVVAALEDLANLHHSLCEYAQAKPLLNRLARMKGEQFLARQNAKKPRR